MCEDNTSFGDLFGCRDYMTSSELRVVESLEQSILGNSRPQYINQISKENQDNHASGTECGCKPIICTHPEDHEGRKVLHHFNSEEHRKEFVEKQDEFVHAHFDFAKEK